MTEELNENDCDKIGPYAGEFDNSLHMISLFNHEGARATGETPRHCNVDGGNRIDGLMSVETSEKYDDCIIHVPESVRQHLIALQQSFPAEGPVKVTDMRGVYGETRRRQIIAITESDNWKLFGTEEETLRAVEYHHEMLHGEAIHINRISSSFRSFRSKLNPKDPRIKPDNVLNKNYGTGIKQNRRLDSANPGYSSKSKGGAQLSRPEKRGRNRGCPN